MAAAPFTDQEMEILRLMMERVTFTDQDSSGDGRGGDVTMEPGLGVDGARDGRIVLFNPGGTTRPFVTIRDGDRELDLFLGSKMPGPEVEAREGSLFFWWGESGSPRFYRRDPGGWWYVL